MSVKVIEFIQEESRKSKQVPTIKSMVDKKIVKNGKEFYKYFSSLEEACTAADVPVPLARIQRVKSAVTKHKLTDKRLTNPGDNGKLSETQQPNEKPVPSVVITDPSLAAMSKQVSDQELEAVKSGSELELVERLEKAKRKDQENKERIQAHKDAETARKMRYNFTDYDREMRNYYDSHPTLQRRLQYYSIRFGWRADFATHYDQLILDQFEIFNRVATLLPEASRRMSLNIDELPVDPNLASEQWEGIMGDLSNTLAEAEYERTDLKLRNLRPDFHCPVDRTLVRHVNGVNFACQRGHPLSFHCPECGSPLTYSDNRFSCGACLKRFYQQ